jgi:protease I
MGAIYTDEDLVMDGDDLVTGRTGGHYHVFARRIIDVLSSR